MKLKIVLILIFSASLTGCFRVGRLPGTTASGPSYDDARSAVVVPKGAGTAILSVNGEAVHTDLGDRFANLTLNILLMYLEPQVYVKPGQNVIGARGSESSTVNYGAYSVKTTRWRDYTVPLQAQAGQRYFLTADVNGGTSLALDTSEKAPGGAVVAAEPPAPPPVPAKTAQKHNRKPTKLAKATKAK